MRHCAHIFANPGISRVLFFIFSLCAIQTYAQTIQNGKIQEYNEREKKTPLEGVELTIRSAGSTVSDKSGNFKLQFLTLKPGERVNVRRIEKLGYEIFNKEAVEQWNINPKEPFVIVMCRSDRFKKLRDNYRNGSLEGLTRKLKQKEAELSKLKQTGKIKELAYREKLGQLREEHEKQLDRLDSYIDRFSRIDLSEISETELEILSLVQEGDMDEAIKRYESLNAVEKYIHENADLKKISDGISQLSALEQSKIKSTKALKTTIDNHILTLKLIGGIENINKVDSIFNKLISADSTDITTLLSYGNFIREYTINYNKALNLFHRVLSISTSPQYSGDALNNIGITYMDLRNYDEGLKYCQKALDFHLTFLGESNNTVAKVYSNIGCCQMYLKNFDAANNYFIKALNIYHELQDNSVDQAMLFNNLGGLCDYTQKYQNALSYYNKALSMIQTDTPTFALIINNIGLVHFHLGNYPEAINKFSESMDLRRKILGDTHRVIATSLQNIGTSYNRINDFENAIKCAEEEIEIRSKLPFDDRDELSFAYLRAGDAYNKSNRPEKAKINFDKALKIRLELFGDDDYWVKQLKNH